MKMRFDYDKVDAIAKALGGRIELLERLHEKAGLSPDDIEIILNSDYHGDFFTIYGFHIDSNESDPSEAVTYLKDAVGFKPAFMDYSTGKFNYGSWEDAFFMPRPCMLKYDGTVDYYLDPNDYSKKEDGTASDVANVSYNGNAMMEWGRDGRQIWYKVVPDADNSTSASVYFCDYKLDESYHAWSFINSQGNLVKHFYTPIYNGTIDGDGKLRSISGKAGADLCKSKTAQQEITASELNNPGEDKLWYTEVYADITLINLLLVLIGKCLDTQLVFGNGVTRMSNSVPAPSVIGTGTMDDKGLFYGTEDNSQGVKVFGMENWWGNQYRRFAGLVSVNGTIKYKLTRDASDGSSATDYNDSGSGYRAFNFYVFDRVSGYARKQTYSEKGTMMFSDYAGNNRTYYADLASVDGNGTKYACRGGDRGFGLQCGAFCLSLDNVSNMYTADIGASLSCKPLS